MSGFTLTDVHFAYGETPVMRGVTLSIPRGEMICIMGPNGAGKSTLLKLMCGLLKPSRGEIALNATPLPQHRPSSLAKKLAYCPQDRHIPFSFTAMEIVLMGRAPYMPRFGFESSADVEIAGDAMRKTDCLEFAGRDIAELSGGERQRVMIARALAQSPQALLLDEPTTFLDIRHSTELGELLIRLNREGGLTIIAAMHDIHLARRTFGRTVLLKKGSVVHDGVSNEVMTSENIRQTFDIKKHATLFEDSR